MIFRMTEPEPPRRWATRGEAAAHLGVSLATLHRLVVAGRITAYQINPGSGLTRYDLHEIDAMVTATAAPAPGRNP